MLKTEIPENLAFKFFQNETFNTYIRFRHKGERNVRMMMNSIVTNMSGITAEMLCWDLACSRF